MIPGSHTVASFYPSSLEGAGACKRRGECPQHGVGASPTSFSWTLPGTLRRYCMDLVKRLEAYRERERTLKWEGSFAQYFEIATLQPSVTELSHERIYNMIVDAGSESTPQGDTHYHFFDDEIFGDRKS